MSESIFLYKIQLPSFFKRNLFLCDLVKIFDLIIVKDYIYVLRIRRRKRKRKGRHSLLFICSSENFNKTASRRPGQGIP